MQACCKIFIFLICLVPLFAQAKLFDAGEFYLENGARVIVIPNHKAPIAKLMVWYRVGSMDEAIGQGGLAHLLEHLMFRGTKNVPDSSFNEIILRNGGESNAFTTQDFTVYHELVDVSRLETAMALEADRMTNLNLSPEAVVAERDIVLDERRQRVTMKPASVFQEDLTRMLWQGKSYARPVSGTEPEISGLNGGDVLNFYKKFYAPNNAVIVISGDVTKEQGRVLAEKYFGGIKPLEGLQTREDNNRPENQSEMRLKRAMANVATPRIIRHYVIPSIRQNRKDAYALMLFAAFLDDGENSYFNQNLVLTEKVAGAGASADIMNRAGGTFSLVAVPFPNKTVEETEKVLNETVVEAIKNISDQDLQKLKSKQSANLVYVRDNPADAAYIAGLMASLGLSLEEIENYEQNIQAVTLQDIRQAVQNMLDQATTVTGVLLPLSPVGKEKK